MSSTFTILNFQFNEFLFVTKLHVPLCLVKLIRLIVHSYLTACHIFCYKGFVMFLKFVFVNFPIFVLRTKFLSVPLNAI